MIQFACRDAFDLVAVPALVALLLSAGCDPSTPAPPASASQSASMTSASATSSAEDDAYLSARGGMWGDEIGDAFGSGSLGAAGPGEEVRPGPIGVPVPANPRIRFGVVKVGPGAPPDMVRRLVRQVAGRLGRCYESVLAANPKAAGTIAVTFTITKEGDVSAAKGEGQLPDAMVKCVSRQFYALSFPETDGRAVVVVVPVKFVP